MIYVLASCSLIAFLWDESGSDLVEPLLMSSDTCFVHTINLCKEAGKYKAELKRISLADCFCITLAKRIGTTVATSDHHEFDKVSTRGIVPVLFIR